jgi:hypothetical protein
VVYGSVPVVKLKVTVARWWSYKSRWWDSCGVESQGGVTVVELVCRFVTVVARWWSLKILALVVVNITSVSISKIEVPEINLVNLIDNFNNRFSCWLIELTER